MATKVRELVERVRSELHGGSADTLSVLDKDYTPGESSISLRYPFPAVMPGQLVSAGLATFYVLGVGSGGRSLQVLPGADDGVDRGAGAGDIVRLNARYTTASIFREWNAGLRRLSAPKNGVYAYGSFTAPVNPISGVYFLPDIWADQRPLQLLIARYHLLGTTAWQRISADYQLDQNAVRIIGQQPLGSTVEFVFAFPFLEATTLDTDAEACGLNEWTMEIPGLFACARLGRGKETRRVRVDAEGDPRRADEVPAGANLGVSRDWLADAMQRTMEESGRLLSQFGYAAIPIRDGTPTSGSFV